MIRTVIALLGAIVVAGAPMMALAAGGCADHAGQVRDLIAAQQHHSQDAAAPVRTAATASGQMPGNAPTALR